MGRRSDHDKPHPPRFPRKRWQPGQAPHVEEPAKGKGSYDRRRAGDDIDGELAEGPPPAPPPDADPA